MRRALVIMLVMTMAGPALGDAFIPGEFSGWDAGVAMTETAAGSGIWEYQVTGFSDGELPTEFVLLSEANNWDSKYIPSGNQCAVMDPNGDNLITLDTNEYDDGWFPTMNRVGVSYAQDQWTAVGDWQGWDNANSATAMMDMGGGIYYYEQEIAGGDHEWKAVRTGTWNSIGGDSRSINANNFSFTVEGDSQLMGFYVNALEGTIKVEVVPEPASLALLALGGLALLRRRG